jgi:mannose-1-phosphate guanylyltransferase
MVNETADRLTKVCAGEDVFVVTNKIQAQKIKEVSVGKISPQNVLEEPSARNTSACIGYSAIKILKEKSDGVMIVTQSDAYIKDTEEFARVLKVAVSAAEQTNGIITIGITPTYPATGYGYIEYGNASGEVKPVSRFVEKPNLEKAKEYIAQGGYVWNSGIFVFKASVILDEFKKHIPDVYADIERIGVAIGTSEENKVIEETYPFIRSISVDYGVMEKTDKISVIPASFGWNDVGSLDALEVLHPADSDGNVKVGDVVSADTTNTIAYSSGRTVATVGVDNLIVVETSDAVLVCAKDRAQDVKKIVETLKKSNRENLL